MLLPGVKKVMARYVAEHFVGNQDALDARGEGFRRSSRCRMIAV
jgi:hypothetical protein